MLEEDGVYTGNDFRYVSDTQQIYGSSHISITHRAINPVATILYEH